LIKGQCKKTTSGKTQRVGYRVIALCNCFSELSCSFLAPGAVDRRLGLVVARWFRLMKLLSPGLVTTGMGDVCGRVNLLGL